MVVPQHPRIKIVKSSSQEKPPTKIVTAKSASAATKTAVTCGTVRFAIEATDTQMECSLSTEQG